MGSSAGRICVADLTLPPQDWPAARLGTALLWVCVYSPFLGV